MVPYLGSMALDLLRVRQRGDRRRKKKGVIRSRVVEDGRRVGREKGVEKGWGCLTLGPRSALQVSTALGLLRVRWLVH